MRIPNIAGALLLLSSCGWASIVVQNYSFEDPSVHGGFQYLPTDPSVMWSFSGNAGVAAAAGVANGFNIAAAPDGNQVAFLEGGTPEISQTISGLTVGQNYLVSFFAAQRPDVGNAPRFVGGGQDFEVFWNTTPIGIFLPSSTTFSLFDSLTFTPTATSGVLLFKGLDSNTSCGSPTPCDRTAFIDDVQINADVAVPEPSSAMMLFSGAGMIAFGFRRKFTGGRRSSC
jgi:hypothetical protein